MDGRTLAAWILCGTVAVSSGCKWGKGRAASNTMPVAQPIAVAENEPKGPFKSSTIAAFADVQVEDAFSKADVPVAERDRRLDEARQKFETALKQDPKSLEAQRGLGRLYVRLGDKDRAAAAYRTAMNHHPKDHALAHEAALCFGRFDDWQSALGCWEQALALDPANRKYPRMIGIAHARLGNFEAGFNAMVKVVGEAEARAVMARELFEAGQTEPAKQQLELAMKADPNSPTAQQLNQQFGGLQQTGYQGQ